MGLSEPVAAPEADPFADALLAARLLAADPAGLGGIRLRAPAGGAGRLLVDALRDLLPPGTPVRTLPSHIDDNRLLGGVDIAASLGAGRTIRRPGLLAEAAGGLIVVPSAERMAAATAGRIVAALEAAPAALLLLDHGVEDEQPPAALLERVAFHLDIPSPLEGESAERSEAGGGTARGGSHGRGGSANVVGPHPPRWRSAPSPSRGEDEMLRAIASTAQALGVDSMRACLFALRAARASADLAGREHLDVEDVALAARLVLAPRATRWPKPEAEPPPPDPGDASERQSTEDKLEDLVLDAARAAVPPDLLAAIGEARAGRSAARPGGAGDRRRSPLRGRPVGTRPGTPGSGRRLALVDTLRAAAPWQRLRARDAGGEPKLRLRREDLRVRRFEDRSEALAIFAVDASGSSARARLAEAKGAVELLLAQAYARRVEVALVAFRGQGAETLLPPTRSLTRARRLLAELPGGGGTPLAAGLDQARLLAEAGRARGRTPYVVLLTDGRANIAADGSASRAQADVDALAAARRFAASGFGSTVIDIGPRQQPEASRVADAMRARYLHLPRADAAAVHAALDL